MNTYRNRVVVSIVNWRTADFTIDCLKSIEPEIEKVGVSSVVVVDNNSGDGSDMKIEGAIRENSWNAWVRLHRAEGNRGFAAGNNVVINDVLEQSDRPEYVLLLNPDTIIRPGALQIIVQFMDSHPDVGIAGGRSEDPDGTPQAVCGISMDISGLKEAELELVRTSQYLRNVMPQVAGSDG